MERIALLFDHEENGVGYFHRSDSQELITSDYLDMYDQIVYPDKKTGVQYILHGTVIQSFVFDDFNSAYWYLMHRTPIVMKQSDEVIGMAQKNVELRNRLNHLQAQSTRTQNPTPQMIQESAALGNEITQLQAHTAQVQQRQEQKPLPPNPPYSITEVVHQESQEPKPLELSAPKKLTRQQIVQRFNEECQADLTTGDRLDAISYNAFVAARNTVAFEITRYQLSFMRTRVNSMFTHEHGMTQRHLEMAKNYVAKGNARGGQSMIEMVNQSQARIRVYTAFFRAVKDVVEK